MRTTKMTHHAKHELRSMRPPATVVERTELARLRHVRVCVGQLLMRQWTTLITLKHETEGAGQSKDEFELFTKQIVKVTTGRTCYRNSTFPVRLDHGRKNWLYLTAIVFSLDMKSAHLFWWRRLPT